MTDYFKINVYDETIKRKDELRHQASALVEHMNLKDKLYWGHAFDEGYRCATSEAQRQAYLIAQKLELVK